jgi:hypothetical protein
VVFGLDDAVGGAAFAGDVAGSEEEKKNMLVISIPFRSDSLRNRGNGAGLQIDDFSLLVLHGGRIVCC